MAVARRAAFTAPARPMASVPTGIPAGIWTIERRESTPLRAFDSTGTPRTGSAVLAAVMPGRGGAPRGARPRPRTPPDLGPARPPAAPPPASPHAASTPADSTPASIAGLVDPHRGTIGRRP